MTFYRRTFEIQSFIYAKLFKTVKNWPRVNYLIAQWLRAPFAVKDKTRLEFSSSMLKHFLFRPRKSMQLLSLSWKSMIKTPLHYRYCLLSYRYWTTLITFSRACSLSRCAWKSSPTVSFYIQELFVGLDSIFWICWLSLSPSSLSSLGKYHIGTPTTGCLSKSFLTL